MTPCDTNGLTESSSLGVCVARFDGWTPEMRSEVCRSKWMRRVVDALPRWHLAIAICCALFAQQRLLLESRFDRAILLCITFISGVQPSKRLVDGQLSLPRAVRSQPRCQRAHCHLNSFVACGWRTRWCRHRRACHSCARSRGRTPSRSLLPGRVDGRA